MTLARQEVIDEHELYPVHEEDTVPDSPEHEYQARYLRDALASCLRQHFVTGEVCMYWIPGEMSTYVAPDVLLVEGLGEERLNRVYLSWTDPAALLVIEVGSRSTFRRDTGPKVERYLNDIGVREYLYCSVKRDLLRLWRREGAVVVEATAKPGERLRSRELGIEFGIEPDGFIRAYAPDGEPLPTHLELDDRVAEERRRADDLENEVARLRAELLRRESGSGAG